jgi:hypothetical protein
MKTNKTVVILSILVGLAAGIAAITGLFWQDAGRPYNFTSLHGQTVPMYGSGLYQFDSSLRAPIYRGTDAVTLLVFLPLLVYAILTYQSGALRGRFLLAGALAPFLYNSISLAFGAAYNTLFLLYIVYFTLSVYAFIMACTQVDLNGLLEKLAPRAPRTGMAILLFISGLSVFVWLIDIIGSLAQGQAPSGLQTYTTDVTAVIDVGLICPTAYLTGILLLRRQPLGYLLASIMLMLNAVIGAVVIGQTIFQVIAGIILPPGQMIGFVGSFVVTGAFATWFTVRLQRSWVG